MAKIVWSLRAMNDRKKIFEYWNDRNKSTTYSNKLNTIFKQTLILINDYPLLGKRTNFEHIRLKIVKNYFIFYKKTETHLIVLPIWDCNQDIKNLHLI